MGSVTGIKGQALNIDLLQDSRDNGWIISGGKAVHNGCNQGYIELLNSAYTPGVANIFEYIVSDYASGNVNIKVGTVNGATETSNGIKKQSFTPVANDKVMFFSDGNLAVDVLAIYPAENAANGMTVGFSEMFNKWVSYYSYQPEMMVTGLNRFFTNRGGEMWEHGANELRNVFYDQEYSSKLVFYVNLSPTEFKTFFGMRQITNKLWTAATKGDIFIYPTEGKPNGQASRLKAARFRRLLDQSWFADFLRDMNDTRFISEEQALMNGALLQGNTLKITLANNSTDEVRLLSVDIIMSKQNYSY